MVEINDAHLKMIGEMTVELTRLRQNECKHLAVENIAPEIFEKLVRALRQGLWGN